MIFLIMTEYNNTAMIFKAVLFELVEKVDKLLDGNTVRYCLY